MTPLVSRSWLVVVREDSLDTWVSDITTYQMEFTRLVTSNVTNASHE
jgi:hypothetical protein